MDKVINLALPYVGEQVFESLETDALVQCLEVSEAWKILAGNVLLKRWKHQNHCSWRGCDRDLHTQEQRAPLVSSTIMSKFVNFSMLKFIYDHVKICQRFLLVMPSVINDLQTMLKIINDYPQYYQL